MNRPPFITAEDVEHRLSWTAVADALAEGHRRPRADIQDLLLRRGENALLNRAAWIDGAGIALKSVSVFPANPSRQPPRPSVQGAVLLFDDLDGHLRAVIDGGLVTRWKTAGDSVLGARLLARTDSRRLLIVGAGAVAESLVAAYSEVFPSLESIRIWNRSRDKAAALAKRFAAHAVPVGVAEDLPSAVAEADIIATATLARSPVLQGEWVRPGTHVDLIGAFTPQMREADDALLRKGQVFVDARETTVGEIGELMIPIAAGVIGADDVRGDLYDLCNGAAGRREPDAITVYKNGGGAHLDLMTAGLMQRIWQAAQPV